MRADVTDGFGGLHGAPAAAFWHCPRCLHATATVDWQPLKGDPDTRVCPVCQAVYATDARMRAAGPTDLLRHHELAGAARISGADAAARPRAEAPAQEYTFTLDQLGDFLVNYLGAGAMDATARERLAGLLEAEHRHGRLKIRRGED